MDYKKKVISGSVWGMSQNVLDYSIRFVTGIIIARIVGPEAYGLIAMLTIFVSVSESLIDGGLSSALIRQPKSSENDYSTVFYFNLFICICLYIFLWFGAYPISSFFNEPRLVNILHVYGIVLIINATFVIQRTIYTKKLRFKALSVISILASLVSGIIGVIYAYWGYGVWSLVIQIMSQSVITSLLFWFFGGWKPKFIFDYNSFKSLFSFGIGILGSSIIGKLYKEINKMLIGRFLGSIELGYYAKANSFSDMPCANINMVVSKVSYPILSELQDDYDRFRSGYVKILITTFYISVSSCILLAIISEPLISITLGEKWERISSYIPILCIAGILYPLQSVNQNLLSVKGKSNLIFLITCIDFFLRLVILLITLPYGIVCMLWGLVLISVLEYFLCSFWSGLYIKYGLVKQIYDILPTLIKSGLVGYLVYFLCSYFQTNNYCLITLQISVYILLTVILGELTHDKGYFYLREIVKPYFDKYRN